MRDADSGSPKLPHFFVIEKNPMGQPDVVRDPPRPLQIFYGTAAESLEAISLLIHGLRKMRVQPYTQTPRELCGSGHQTFRDGKRRTGSQGYAGHRAGGRIVVGLYDPLAVG